jgi:hypothetical protein
VALQAASEYTDELQGLSDGDKTSLKNSFGDLTVDSPRTALAASRFKRIQGMATIRYKMGHLTFDRSGTSARETSG